MFVHAQCSMWLPSTQKAGEPSVFPIQACPARGKNGSSGPRAPPSRSPERGVVGTPAGAVQLAEPWTPLPGTVTSHVVAGPVTP